MGNGGVDGGLVCPPGVRASSLPDTLPHGMAAPGAPWLRSTKTWRKERKFGHLWWPKGVVGEGEGSSAPLLVPAARVPFMGSKEECPGPGEDIPRRSGAGSNGRRPEDKWIWDMMVPCGAGAQPALGPHLSSTPTDLHGHRSSAVRGTVTFTGVSAPDFCPFPMGTWGWEDSKGDVGAFPSWTWWLWAGNVLLTLPTWSLVVSQPGEDVWALG